MVRAQQGAKNHMREVKPRIKKIDGVWTCTGKGISETGATPKDAYDNWILNIPDAEERNVRKAS